MGQKKSSTQNKKGRISGYVKHIFYFTTFRITYNEHKEKFQIMSSNNNNNMNRITKRKNEQKRRKNEQKKSKKSKKRKLSNSGASSDKRQRLSSDTSDSFDSTISEALPETFGGETKESDSDRRGREKKEREQKKTEEAAERERQRYAKSAASQSIPCLANIGGKRVEKNGIIEFEGGTDFWSILEQTRSRGGYWYSEGYY